MGLRTADKPESMDICFVGQRDYRGFLRDTAPEVFEPGPLVASDGTELGRHDGVVGFTVGQRRGLGVAVGEPRFVVRIDSASSTVVLGRREELAVAGVGSDQLTWTEGAPFSGQIMAQYRAHGEPGRGDAARRPPAVRRAQEAVAPGQTVAFYDEDRVLGGGLIAETFV